MIMRQKRSACQPFTGMSDGEKALDTREKPQILGKKNEAPKGFALFMLADAHTSAPKSDRLGVRHQAWAAFSAALRVGLGRMIALHLSASAL
jgi:hypothetical protein